MLNETDLIILSWLNKMMHTYLPFTNYYLWNLPIGEYGFYYIMLYVIGEIYLIMTGNYNKKGVKKK